MGIKAVIFDVGGVLVRTESRAGRETWANRLGMPPLDYENLVFNSESGRQAQLGQKSWSAHWAWLQEHFHLSADDLALMRRDFFAGDVLNQPLIKTIKELRAAGYQLGILSNFHDEARQLWTQDYPFLHLFDAVIISAEVGVMKPAAKIYRLAVEALAVQPSEAVFLDDFIENVSAAQAVGLTAIHFRQTDQALHELQRALS